MNAPLRLALPVLAVLLFLTLAGNAARLGAAEPDAKKDEAKATDLPIKRVVLFSSGVGYFEHEGNISGDAKVELKFQVEEVNDLLKSMVVEDQGGGRVTSVGYGSREPVTRRLKTFSIDLTKNLTLADLLKQVRGETVVVEAPQPITGKIVSLERRKIRFGKDESMEVDVLNLLTPTGLRSITLDTIGQARLVDEKLNDELQKALAILADANRSDKRTVTIRSDGKGARGLKVGYIQETPIWKTSYRLVLGDDNKPLLQGWAIVENMTEQDWGNVELTFVSGRPISFVMDLYQPLYVGRPVVVPELFASLQPKTYDQDLADEGKQKEAGKRDAMIGEYSKARRKMAPGAEGRAFGMANRAVAAAAPAAPAEKAAADGLVMEESQPQAQARFDPSRGVASVAQADNVGEMFRYRIAHPVSVGRQQSAMLPIVNQKVEGKKVSIYNPAVQAKHPLNGLKLVNSTDLHLMQGPITVFDDGAYAGDAEISDLAPGAERLLSYALDLDVEVAANMTQKPQEMVGLKIVRGTAELSLKYTRVRTYAVKSSSKKPRHLLIEQPIDGSWQLVSPKEPTEKSRSDYRFALDLEPEKKAELKVEEEHFERQAFFLLQNDDQTLLGLSSNQKFGPKIKLAIEGLIKRRAVLAGFNRDQQELDRQLAVVNQEQARIRANMGQLDRTSELYRKYVKKFSEQEDSVDKLRSQVDELRKKRETAQTELEQYVAGLNID